MKYFSGLLVFFAGLGLQWIWATHFTLWELAPHVLLILTVAIAARSGPTAGQCYGFVWGLFLDVSSAHVFGANALAFTLAGYAIGMLRRQMDVESMAPQILLIFFLTPAYFLFFGLTGFIFEHNFLWVGWKHFFLVPLLNCAAAPFGFEFVKKFIDF